MLDNLHKAVQELELVLQKDTTFRGEAKSWLINTLAQLQNITPAARWACFHPCNAVIANASQQSSISSSSKPLQGHSHRRSTHIQQAAEPSPVASCRTAELKLLQLLAEASPRDVSTLLLRDPDWVCSYLTASRDRIKAWFGHFGPTGISHFKYGAKALANYALAERGEAWHHLVWAGKHSQSPVAVAVKPHYFGELDVVATVRNLAQSCPGFWCSDELLRSCQAGEWLALDTDAVAKELQRLLHNQRSSRHHTLLQCLSDFLAAADWAQLCRRLLPLLPEKGVLQAAQALAVSNYTQAQQRQQQHHHDTSLLQEWCRQQTACLVQHKASVRPAPTADHADMARLCSVAAAASDVVCVQDGPLLVLGCLQAAGTGAGSWTMDQLLMANILTCYRSQLLSLLWQEDEAGGQLSALVSAAAALCTPAGAGASTGHQQSGLNQPPEGAAPAQAADGKRGKLLTSLPLLLRGLTVSQQLGLLLIAAWLLRLHLLLLLSSAVEHAPEATPGQLQPSPRPPAVVVDLPSGGVGYLLSSAAAGKPFDSLQVNAAGQQPTDIAAVHPHQQREQHPTQNQPVRASDLPQQQQEVKQPLRRGPAADSLPAAAQQATSGSRGSKHPRKHKKHSRKRKHRSSSSSSGGGGGGGGRQRRRKRKGQRRGSSSDSSSDEDDDWAGLDLDAGGQLLDPTDFHAPSKSKSHQSTQRAAADRPATVATSGGGDLAKSAARQQEEPSTSLELSVVVERLSSLAAGGRLWQWPKCVAVLPVFNGLSGAGDDTCVVVEGSIVEVSDVAAQLWLCGMLQQIAARA